jgi:hypothetical protein
VTRRDNRGFACIYLSVCSSHLGFDRRYYDNALIALNFGLNFRQMLSLLANQTHPASRKVKINGLRSSAFQIRCGVLRGCPFRPLAFLVLAEALTRLIIEAPDLKGIDIGSVNHCISQFADNTTIFAKDYNDARHLRPILDLYESATGMRGLGCSTGTGTGTGDPVPGSPDPVVNNARWRPLGSQGE